MGDEAFKKGIQSYYHRYMNGNATTTAFRNEMEKASGKDLKAFFEQWLYKVGNIILKGKWSYDAVSKMVNIDLAQIQNDGFVFTTPIEIGIYGEGKLLPVIQTIQLDALQKRFSIPANAKPDKLSIDPRTILLAQWDWEEEK
jgi:aminopeptidase N